MIRPALRSLIVLSLALCAAACGSLPRPEGPLRIAPEAIMRVEDPRIGANDVEALQALAQDMARRVSSVEGESMLALSGGGANGAYGAGVLVGWTERGDRPEFDIVTGVSTGALAAPFAFLGSRWDDELRDAYTDGRAQGLIGLRALSIFRGPSLFSSAALRGLVDDSVTPELLAAIAAEHAKGRTLLVATTNLDSQETVIWNMGLLASQGDQALPLFRDVLVASASIPGVFPPVLIPGLDSEGRVVMEMHVDGGVNTPFLAIPEELLLWTGPQRRGAGASLYVIINGQAGRNAGVTPGRLGDILARTYDSMSKASARQALAATGAFAARNGMALSVTAIPDNVNVSSLNFGPETMQAVFELGRARSAAGEAWAPVRLTDRPQGAAFDLLPEEAIPDALRPPAAPPPPQEPSVDD